MIHWLTYNIQFAQNYSINKIMSKFSKMQIMLISHILWLITGFQVAHLLPNSNRKFLMLDKTLLNAPKTSHLFLIINVESVLLTILFTILLLGPVHHALLVLPIHLKKENAFKLAAEMDISMILL